MTPDRDVLLHPSERPAADPDSWVWNWDGALESVQAASNRTRGQAINSYCHDTGEWFPHVRAWKRHARSLDRVDHWIWWVESRTDEGWDGHPDTPPDDWQPDLTDEDMPAWEFCRPTADGAVPVWIVAPREMKPPRKVAT